MGTRFYRAHIVGSEVQNEEVPQGCAIEIRVSVI